MHSSSSLSLLFSLSPPFLPLSSYSLLSLSLPSSSSSPFVYISSLSLCHFFPPLPSSVTYVCISLCGWPWPRSGERRLVSLFEHSMATVAGLPAYSTEVTMWSVGRPTTPSGGWPLSLSDTTYVCTVHVYVCITDQYIYATVCIIMYLYNYTTS